MELDDLRRRWQQQPTPAELTPDQDALHNLLTQRAAGPVVRMQRNARTELLLTIISLAVGTAGVVYSRISGLRSFWLLLVATCLLMGFYYYRKLRILGQLQTGTNALRHQVAEQVHSLRALLQLYYSITMLTLVVVAANLLYWFHDKNPLFFHNTQRLVWLVLTLVVSALLTHWLTKWTLQHLYGRYLDRLEAALRELQEPG